jgi:hypothetical protein
MAFSVKFSAIYRTDQVFIASFFRKKREAKKGTTTVGGRNLIGFDFDRLH